MIEIPLTRGFVAVIDDEDARLTQFRWHVEVKVRNGSVSAIYAARTIRRNRNGKRVAAKSYLHAEVLCPPAGTRADHIDGNGLNCRRSNLRPVTESQNQQNRRISANNSSGFKGVHRSRWRHPWKANIRVSGRCVYLGTFAAAEDAARAYDAAARAIFGEFAALNFPARGERSALSPRAPETRS